MSYTCQTCSAEAEKSHSLCNPATEDQEAKFCGFEEDMICADKIDEMKFTCDTCGSMSADSEHLCNPRSLT